MRGDFVDNLFSVFKIPYNEWDFLNFTSVKNFVDNPDFHVEEKWMSLFYVGNFFSLKKTPPDGNFNT